MQAFNLFQMSRSFKIKWLILEFILTIILTYVLKNVLHLNRALCKDILKKTFAPALFFVRYLCNLHAQFFILE